MHVQFRLPHSTFGNEEYVVYIIEIHLLVCHLSRLNKSETGNIPQNHSQVTTSHKRFFDLKIPSSTSGTHGNRNSATPERAEVVVPVLPEASDQYSFLSRFNNRGAALNSKLP